MCQNPAGIYHGATLFIPDILKSAVCKSLAGDLRSKMNLAGTGQVSKWPIKEASAIHLAGVTAL